MTSETKVIGVVIGRFQVDELHPGHVDLLRHVAQKHRHMLVMLGCRAAPADSEHALDYRVRAQMINAVCPDAVVVAVYDTAENDVWSRTVDQTINALFPEFSAVLYGGRDSFASAYSGKFETRELDFCSDHSGTARRELIAQTSENDPAFRRGVIHAIMNLRPRVFFTVDIAVLRPPLQVLGLDPVEHGNAAPEVLLGRKADEHLWRFPGGFIDLKDKDGEEAAARELQEETGLTAHTLGYVGSLTVDDWRSRGANDVGHKTILYKCTSFSGDPKGNDDLPLVGWFPLAAASRDRIVDAHKPLFDMLLERI
ncbi:MAG: NUDIX domain-containing protein [Bacteroidales bacterium]|nr:NUDIX domain-containing protein [Candidatus Latescibacterota bacterium]